MVKKASIFYPVLLMVVFSSLVECEGLIDSHKKVIDGLDEYIKNEERRITTLKQQLEKYKSEHEIATADISNYLGNPLNAFTLVKRLTVDLGDIERNIEFGTDFFKNMTVGLEDALCPTAEDLVGVAAGLKRLQHTYKLEVRELADGILNHVAYGTPLSASDCFELGRLLYVDHDNENSIQWMKEALRKYKEESNMVHSFTEIDIYDYISYAYHLFGDPENAVIWLNKLLEVDPNHIRRFNMPMFEEKLRKKREEIEKQHHSQINETKQNGDSKENLYEALCRGDLVLPHFLTKRLKCFYKNDTPFLKLAPIKTEQLYRDPEVYIFYDVISDEEIDLLKNLARPKFSRASVLNANTGEKMVSQTRISKLAWLKDSEAPVVARVTRRIADFTGLTMTFAEELQVQNYGIGGHYVPHYDYTSKYTNLNDRSTRRIATVLFYLSEVAQGGATVFTKLGVSVFPIKNAALFWMNLHPSCEGDRAALHAACPVLRGSKWVANKWIPYDGQEFIRPCTLEYQTEDMPREFPRPIHKDNCAI